MKQVRACLNFQVTGWLCTILWGCLVIVPALQVYKYSRNEDFTILAQRERDRIVQFMQPQANYQAI